MDSKDLYYTGCLNKDDIESTIVRGEMVTSLIQVNEKMAIAVNTIISEGVSIAVHFLHFADVFLFIYEANQSNAA